MANSTYNPIPRIVTISPITDDGVYFYIAVLDIPNSMIIDNTSSISNMTPDPTDSTALMATLINMNPFPPEGTNIDPTETTTFLLPMLTGDIDGYDNNRVSYANLNIYDSENVPARGQITKSKFVIRPVIIPHSNAHHKAEKKEAFVQEADAQPTDDPQALICAELFMWRTFVLQNSSNTDQYYVGGLLLNNSTPCNCLGYYNHKLWGSNGVYGSSFNYGQTFGKSSAPGVNTLCVTLTMVNAAPPLLTIAGVLSSTYGQYTNITRAEEGQGISIVPFDYDNIPDSCII